MHWIETALGHLLLYVFLYVWAYKKHKVAGGALVPSNIGLTIQVLMCVGIFCALDLLLYFGGFESIRYLLQAFEGFFWRAS